jgi:hypothetical protein
VDKINWLGSNNNYLNNIFDFYSYTIAELGVISNIFAYIFIFDCFWWLFIINWKKILTLLYRSKYITNFCYIAICNIC